MMLLRLSRLTAAFVLLAASLPAVQRDQSPPPTQEPAPDATPPLQVEPKQMFFAGQVTAIDPEHITVSRTLVGHSPESRTFSINKRTKVSKSVHVKARVTVRFRHETDEDVALEVQVHPPGRSTRNSG